jgi:hypothetical protein
MTNLVSSIKSLLPQNEHTRQAARLNQEVNSLEQSLTNKTGTVFQSKVAETAQMLGQEKTKCLTELTRMNGSYYQDPNSGLKKAWDKVVASSMKALNVKVERLEQLPEIRSQLEPSDTEEKAEAKKKIGYYQAIETKRNARKAQLERIIAIEKASLPNFQEQLKQKKEALLKEHNELCGNYFGDSNGKLDQAWKRYQTAIEHGSTGEHSLKAYQDLEERRKTIEAELQMVDEQISIPSSPDRTIESLTTDSIAKQIEQLKGAHANESKLSGVDWREMAIVATEAAVIGSTALLPVPTFI